MTGFEFWSFGSRPVKGFKTMRHLIWSFGSEHAARVAVGAIEKAYPEEWRKVGAQVDFKTLNLYISDYHYDTQFDYITGICRGVAHALRDKSIFC